MVNTSKLYGFNAAQTRNTLGEIAKTEGNMMNAIMGDGDAQATTHKLAWLKALLGEIYVRAKEILDDMKAELEARKGLLELAKG